MRTYGLSALLFVGFSLLLSCEWSYEAWQDYWPWDPAFTSSLMTWLVIAGALHLLLAERRWGYFRDSARFAAGLSFVTALLSTFVVRSGSIQSVHSFAEDPRIRMILLMALAALAVSVAIFARWMEEERWPRGGKPMYLGVGSLVLMSLGVLYAYAIFAALLVNTFGSGGASMSGEYLSGASYPLGVLGVVILVLATRTGGRRESALVIAPAGVAAALYGTGYLDVQGVIAVARLRLDGDRVSHLAISLLLLGLLVASSPLSAATDFTEVGEVEGVGPYSVELTDFTYEEGVRFGGRFDVEGRGEGWAVLQVDEDVMKKGVFIDRGLLDDVYLTFDGVGGALSDELLVMGSKPGRYPGCPSFGSVA
ncbi:MAG: Cytochrome c biogenesis protein CcsA [Methanonatronarchaeales archaeon]|nr:Cytochrome c biogenesis protein CcsA [Methanonatronarchaeales archaeon]